MKTKQEKPEKPGNDMITFQNFCIKHNLKDMDVTGLKTDIQTTEQAEFKEKELEKLFKTYKNKPAFKT